MKNVSIHIKKSEITSVCAFVLFTLLFARTDGRLQIHFYNAEAYTTYDGKYCDGDHYECDAFIKVYLNGKLDFISPWIWDTHAPKFDRRYVSEIIRNTSRLTIEMWDKKWQSVEAVLMERWTFHNPSEILAISRLEGYHTSEAGETNKIFFDAYWSWKKNYVW